MTQDDIENENYIKISQAAVKKFRKHLTKEELDSCYLFGLWKSLEKFDSSKNVKFTSFLYLNIRIECYHIMYQKFSWFKRHSSLNTSTLVAKSIDTTMFELADKENDLLKSRFIDKKSMQEIADDYKVSVKTIRKRLKEIINYLKNV